MRGDSGQGHTNKPPVLCSDNMAAKGGQQDIFVSCKTQRLVTAGVQAEHTQTGHRRLRRARQHSRSCHRARPSRRRRSCRLGSRLPAAFLRSLQPPLRRDAVVQRGACLSRRCALAPPPASVYNEHAETSGLCWLQNCCVRHSTDRCKLISPTCALFTLSSRPKSKQNGNRPPAPESAASKCGLKATKVDEVCILQRKNHCTVLHSSTPC